ncbi:hypothetical protein [Roseinatronobacter alkalisoli]|uniref:Dihydroorotate dehydrogenase n=1 Tax=Roseinatronobacter alkalisoli TaxID=3028235 RepID=A0ABT5T377_9RHOB|nr:hypothetical protein [Roseinatronobacter sp. HJB301]MDD7969577.1 hypothetical protein [Roseinatronobacter sp. HJB301]
MSTEKEHDTGRDPLDAFFAAARDQAPGLSPDLRARILTDAANTLEDMNRPAQPRPAFPGRLRGWFSGWAAPSLAGGLAAAAAGFWFGIAAPMPVSALDAPLWLHDALTYLDAISTPLVGLDDPLLLGF